MWGKNKKKKKITGYHLPSIVTLPSRRNWTLLYCSVREKKMVGSQVGKGQDCKSKSFKFAFKGLLTVRVAFAYFRLKQVQQLKSTDTTASSVMHKTIQAI